MENKEIVVLVSCMYQTDYSIIKRLNLQTDAVVVNQCFKNEYRIISYTNKSDETKNVVFISTTERGLSKSRNMAIRNVINNHAICLLCDEDEILDDDYEKKILEGYNYFHEPDVMAYRVQWSGFGKKYSTNYHRINYIQALRVCSVQITFKHSSILQMNIHFDEDMGSGTGNGAGEDTKFMMDCYRKKLKMGYCPNCIASIKESESQWFKGFDDQYFVNFGWVTRRIHESLILSILYIFYYAVSKRSLYSREMSVTRAFINMLKGIFQTRTFQNNANFNSNHD